MAAPQGNQNARVNGKHPGMVVRLKTPTVDLLYEFFALNGNPEPTRVQIQDAIDYAVLQVYGRKLEDERAAIL